MKHFALYLKYKHKLNLKDYLDEKHNGDIVLVSKDIVFKSKSDNDGDILAVLVLNSTGEKLVRTFEIKITKQEQEWLANYFNSEYSSNEELNINGKHKYKIYTIDNRFDITGVSLKNYPQYLSNASESKSAIGGATILLWVVKEIFNWYRAYYEKNEGYFINDKGERFDRLKHEISKEDEELITFVYKSLVQNNVIEGIKHVENGSAGFSKYYLDKITDKDNIDIVSKELVEVYGLSEQQVAKFLYIVKFSIENHNVLKAMKNFISKYNKGRTPADTSALDYWEEELHECTYFGQLVKPLTDIDKQIKQAKEESKRALDSLLNNGMVENNSVSSSGNEFDFEFV